MAAKILVVEDEPTLQETLKYSLERAGYEVSVLGSGTEALKFASENPPDLILMDIMLPGLDGLETTRILRQKLKMPIIMLTARDEEIDRVLGLEIGADDYLSKPFSMRELLARVKAQLRRIKMDMEGMEDQPVKPAEPIRLDNLLIDHNRREVILNGNPLELKPKEYDLLHYLANHRGSALTREKILEDVWGWDFAGGSRSVDVHVRWLREKIETDPSHPKRITTLRGIGYRFEG